MKRSPSLLMLPLLLAAVAAQAEAPAPPGLNPEARARIQHIGTGLLMARRTAPEDAEAEAIRARVEALRGQLQALSAPVTGTLRLESAVPPGTPAAKAAEPGAQGQAERIAGLRQAAQALKAQCETYRAARAPVEAPGLMQRLRGWFTESPAPTSRVGQPRGVTSAALTRLMDLQAQIDAALALPAEKRPSRLKRLAEGLRITNVPTAQALQAPDEAANTPTLSTRTRHRREF